MTPRPGRLTRGERLGRYLVRDLIGEGGIGEVYAAYDPELDRKIALKLLKGAVGGSWEARLKREAQALARLSHPNVVPIFDVGVAEGRVFLAMELVQGRTLRTWSQAPRSRREVLAVFRAAGEGLAAAHRAGLVHRDFKPDNVLIGDDGRVRVLDFGIAKLDPAEDPPPPSVSSEAGERPPLVTLAGARMGTPEYMAPEQHRGQLADARADQFAFCVALYEALYGERPFSGDAGSVWLTTTRGTVNPAPASARVPAWLRRVLLRGLAVDPEARHPSMDALLAALDRDPFRRAGRLALTAGITLAVLAGGGGVWERATRTQRTCEAHVAALDGLITPQARLAARDGLLAAHAGFALADWGRLEAGLDARLAALREEQAALCVEAKAGGEFTPALVSRAGCLAERRSELRTALDAFATATWLDAQDALPALDELPEPRACRQDPLAGNSTATERATVAQARSLAALGRADTALALLGSVSSSPSASLRAEARLVEADAAMRLGRFGQSDAALVAAVADGESAQHDALVATAWSDRVRLASLWRGHPSEAAEYARLARAKIDRLGGDPELEARLDLRLSVALHEASDPAGAAAAASRAIKQLELARGPDDLLVAQALTSLGNAQRVLGHFDEALAAHRRALEIRGKALPAGHPLLAQSLNGLGLALLGKGDAAGAFAAHQQAFGMLDGKPGNPLDLAKTLTGRALASAELGNRAAARSDLEQALQVVAASEEPAHPLTIDLQAHLGDVLAADEQWELALPAHQRAIARARSGEPGSKVGALLLREAQDLVALGRKKEALDRLDEATPLLAGVEADLETARALRGQATR